jgi:hypothetical protein
MDGIIVHCCQHLLAADAGGAIFSRMAEEDIDLSAVGSPPRSARRAPNNVNVDRKTILTRICDSFLRGRDYITSRYGYTFSFCQWCEQSQQTDTATHAQTCT